MNKHSKGDLQQMQSLPLDAKIYMSKLRAKQWYDFFEDNVFVGFSGGKDSTVLSDICAMVCKQVGATLNLMFVNTGLEYPEIQKFVKDHGDYLRDKYGIGVSLDIFRPKMAFNEVIMTHGYPFISKEVAKVISAARRLGDQSKFGKVCLERLNGTHTMKDGNKSLYNCAKYKPLLDVDFKISPLCCDIMKKQPSHDYIKLTGRKPILRQMASESRLREQRWLRYGCNGFDMSSPSSSPLSFWTEQDILHYIKLNSLPIASVYGDIVYEEDPWQTRFAELEDPCSKCEKLMTTGCDRTGCIFCGFGAHLEKGQTRFQRLKKTHPRQYEYCMDGGEYGADGFWIPNKKGLGMAHCLDELNAIYGKDFIRYE